MGKLFERETRQLRLFQHTDFIGDIKMPYLLNHTKELSEIYDYKVTNEYTSGQTIRLRRFPFPYKAALSITSDIDCTDTVDQHNRIQAFMSEEIGIPFTNTFFPLHDQNKGLSGFGNKKLSKNST